MSCQYFAPADHGADTFTVVMPKLTFGRGCLREAGARAAMLGMHRVALLTDPFLVDSDYVETANASMRAAGITTKLYSDIRIEPCDDTVMTAARFLADGNFDGVVSIGGGSVIDTAKAAMIYALHPADFLDYFGGPIGQGRAVPGPVFPHLACPTTSGTGSECTSLSVIRINQFNTKFVIASPHILPNEALVDPACCQTLPGNVVASTGFDLLSHAIECYTARAYTQWNHIDDPAKRPLIQGANPWSDLAAREALQLVGRYLVRGVRDSHDLDARDGLMWGATLAGMAFGNSGTHLPHAMSYGVTHLMHDVTTKDYTVDNPFVPHGISVIVNSPSIFRYTAVAAPERHLAAAGLLGADCSQATIEDAGEILAGRIIEMMKATSIPNGLSGIGFSSNDIKALTESALRQTRAISNSPRETNATDIENLYNGAFAYW